VIVPSNAKIFGKEIFEPLASPVNLDPSLAKDVAVTVPIVSKLICFCL
tara:strand:- start:244 stop:387 length:144 start_codon:yes stop_codon:yes gene_type:complete